MTRALTTEQTVTERPRVRRRGLLDVGEVVGGYRIVASLGGGGMGVVYVAEHLLLGRRAAIKVLRPELSRAPDVVQRFFAEARAVTTIRHPGIVEVYDFGYTEDELAYLVMELLDGVSLADRLEREHRLPIATAVLLTRRVALALAAAHDQGIVHRDIKPDNVFLVIDGEGGPVPQIKLLDFGIARLLDDGPRNALETSQGVVLGTPAYMSPEQCHGVEPCDHRSDLYALGCVCFEMLTGRPPFAADSAFEIMTAHVAAPPPDLREHAADAPAALAAIVDRLLAKDPGHRFQSARELIAALDATIARHGVGRRSAAFTAVGRRPSRRTSSQIPAPRRHHRWLRYAAAGAALAGLLGWRLVA